MTVTLAIEQRGFTHNYIALLCITVAAILTIEMCLRVMP